jgi:predicted RNA binding protein YcfA (HicA-like mRNA interferase family)
LIYPLRTMVFSAKHLKWLVAKLHELTVREVIRLIERNRGVLLRQRGSHRQYEARAAALADGAEVTARTTVAQHAGDVRPGTLRAIERDLEPVSGKGWLKGR